MVQSRYHRDGTEFWLAYWYHEMGGEDLEEDFPEVITTDWWKSLCVSHVIELSRYISGFHVAMNNPLDGRVKRMMEKSQMEWERIGVQCPQGEGYDGVVVDILDLNRWYSPALKRMMRMAFMIRHLKDVPSRGWDKAFFNKSANVLGMEFRNWAFDFRGERNDWNLGDNKVFIPDGSETWEIISNA